VVDTKGKSKEPSLWTLQQASEESGIPYSSLRKLIIDGHLARVQLGDSRRWWVKPSDVRHLIASSTEPATR
jgi:hypothetical protein